MLVKGVGKERVTAGQIDRHLRERARGSNGSGLVSVGTSLGIILTALPFTIMSSTLGHRVKVLANRAKVRGSGGWSLCPEVTLTACQSVLLSSCLGGCQNQRSCPIQETSLSGSRLGTISLAAPITALGCHNQQWLGTVAKGQHFHSHPSVLASVPGPLGGEQISHIIGKDTRRLFSSQRLFKPGAGQGTPDNGLSNEEE